MSVTKVLATDAVADLGRYDAVIDVRSPSEFAEDHLPGAVNWPVLDDDERRIVGTLYKQVSPLKARQGSCSARAGCQSSSGAGSHHASRAAAA